MRRESSQPRTVWADLREHAPHRFDPEPVVEIPEDDGPSRFHQAHQRLSLRVALVDAQAEMRGHHANIANRCQQSAAIARRGSRSRYDTSTISGGPENGKRLRSVWP